MTKSLDDEQLQRCQNCDKKLKYFGPNGYMCPDCPDKEKKNENKNQ